MTTEDIIREHWDELPREMRVKLIEDQSSGSKDIILRAAKELGVELELDSSHGHVSKNEIAQFTVAVMEKYG